MGLLGGFDKPIFGKRKPEGEAERIKREGDAFLRQSGEAYLSDTASHMVGHEGEQTERTLDSIFKDLEREILIGFDAAGSTSLTSDQVREKVAGFRKNPSKEGLDALEDWTMSMVKDSPEGSAKVIAAIDEFVHAIKSL